MKKTAVALLIVLVTVVSGASFYALGRPPGPPPGPHHHGGPFFGGPPGPHPFPPPHGGAFSGGPPGPPPGPPPHEGMLLGLWAAPPPVVEKLKLTDDQLKQMRTAYVDFQNKTRKARIALMGLHDEKRTMLISGQIDQARVAKCDEEIVKLSAEVLGENLKANRELLSNLNPEQVQLLATFPGKMKHRRRVKNDEDKDSEELRPIE